MREFQVTDADRARFESFVYPEPNSGCFLFTAVPSALYGRFKVRASSGAWVAMPGSRFAWMAAGRHIPGGLYLCHKCDTPCCVNIDHLFLGTSAENNQDRDRKGRTGRGRMRLPVGVERIPSGRYRARICDNHERRPRHLGVFDSVAEAEAAWKAARFAWRGY